jgi:hypothetical protein
LPLEMPPAMDVALPLDDPAEVSPQAE